MARYRGTVRGNRGDASRGGSADSGLMGHIRGWEVGAYVFVGPLFGDKDKDEVEIFVSTGSNGKIQQKVAIFDETEDGVEVVLFGEDEKEVARFHVLR